MDTPVRVINEDFLNISVSLADIVDGIAQDDDASIKLLKLFVTARRHFVDANDKLAAAVELAIQKK